MPIVDFHGNYGSPDFPAAEPTLTECRLSAAAWQAAAAELSETELFPFGLINGTVYQGDETPSLSPRRIVRALWKALADPSVLDSQLGLMAGRPVFRGGCELDGEIKKVMADEPGRLVLRSRLTAVDGAGQRLIDITHLPSEVGHHTLVDALKARCEGSSVLVAGWPWLDNDEPRLPFEEVEDLTHGPGWGDGVPVRCYLERGADMHDCVHRLRSEPGVKIDLHAHLHRPLGPVSRCWAEEHRSDNAALGLERLAELLR